MNHSLYSADARTHLKIVILGLVCATLVAVTWCIRARERHRSGYGAPLVKAGHVTAVSGQLPAALDSIAAGIYDVEIGPRARRFVLPPA